MGEEDNLLNKKSVFNEYKVEEVENKIYYSMEYHLPIRFRLLNQGNLIDLHGFCVYIHPVTKELRNRRIIVPMRKFGLMKLLK